MKITRFFLATFLVATASLTATAQTTAPALMAYYRVKDALVATDAAKAKTEATALVSALNKIDAAKLSAGDKKTLATATAKALAITKTGDVETQREAFESLSVGMISLTKSTKSVKGGSAPAYVQFCPMAAEGRGASWLSDKREVRNPYYGDKMLKCGSVKEEI